MKRRCQAFPSKSPGALEGAFLGGISLEKHFLLQPFNLVRFRFWKAKSEAQRQATSEDFIRSPQNLVPLSSRGNQRTTCKPSATCKLFWCVSCVENLVSHELVVNR